jgi:hypothetical protein
VFDAVTIEPDGSVELTGCAPGDWPSGDLHLVDDTGRMLALGHSPATGAARVPPPADGEKTLWDVVFRPTGGHDRALPCAFAETVLAGLPVAQQTDVGIVVVGVRGRDGPVLYQ